jgi:predicted  nucleic acid-binding Zn-ribbon protein
MAEAALGMISDAAAAIRQLEQHAAIAVERARSIADATIEKLNAANARAERAEWARQKAETEAANLRETLATARSETETLRAQLMAAENELTAMQHLASDAECRADEAERRAAEANAALERIVNAIREQFPAGVGSADSGAQRN